MKATKLTYMIRKHLLLFALMAVMPASALFAQSRHYSSQSLAMGSGGTAYVTGFNANFINPANLMLDTYKAKNTFGVMGIGFKAGGDLANVAVYNKYLTTGELIAGETRVNMLNEWFGENSDNVRELSSTFSMSPIGLSHRGRKQAFSLASRVRLTQDFSINKGLAELVTYGLDGDVFSTPTPIDFNHRMVAFGEISLGYAMEFDFIKIPDLPFAKNIQLFVGAAPKYLYGGYTTNLDFNSTLQIERATQNNPFTVTHTFNYNLQTIGELSNQLQAYEAAYNLDKNAKFGDYVDYEGDDLGEAQATGWGLDMGATLQMDVSSLPIPLFAGKKKILRVSMSVTDLGSLSFDQDASNVYANGEFSYVGAQDGDQVGDFFDNLGDSLQSDVYGNFDAEIIGSVDYNLPSMYNFGASLEMGKLLLAMDYGIGFNNNGINSDRSVMNLGAQYRLLGFIPLRVGTRIGGYSSASYSAGFGLDFSFLEFTVGASTVANSTKHGTAAGVAWSGLYFRF